MKQSSMLDFHYWKLETTRRSMKSIVVTVVTLLHFEPANTELKLQSSNLVMLKL